MKNGNANLSKNTSERLKDEDKFRMILEYAPVGIGELQYNPPRFKWVNKAICRFIGYTEEELLRINPFDIIAEENKKIFQERMRKILAGKKITPSVDYKIKTKSGRFLWANFSMNWIHKNGKVIGSLIFTRDITKRKKAEEKLKESEERFFKAFRLNPTPMAISFPDGEFIDVNNSFQRLTGFTREAVIGKRGVDLGLYSVASEREEIIRKLRQEGHVYNFSMTFNTKSMKKVNVLFSLEQIKLQNKSRVLGSAIDITEKKQLQDELENYSHNLEELIKQKTKQLREKERFAVIGQTAGMIGHDIRNPLQSMDGAIYLAREYVESLPEDSEEKKELSDILKMLREQVTYIDHMVADLQDFAKSARPRFKDIDLPELITESLGMVEIPENVIVNVVLPEDPLKLITDPNYLKRIFSNLFKNAVQAMPDGGELTIITYRKDGNVWVRIEDTGEGIPEDIKPHIFTPLFTTKSKGQGFGLAVCKKLVEAQGGEITFQSEEGKGSTFTIKLQIEH
jgi:PAS domain S-box-containing protein